MMQTSSPTPANSGQTGKAKKVMPQGRRFQKGVSGNPTGRPCLPQEIKDMAQAAAPAAFRKLISLTDHENPIVAMRACEIVMDRGYGKPVQAQEISGPNGGPQATTITLEFVAPKPRQLN